VNETPFNGLTGYDHLGDGDYFENKLYVPAEQYVSCSNHGNSAVLVFDSGTLARVSVFPLHGNQEVSGVVVRPESRQLWVSSYCDGSQLWVYDLDHMSLLRTVQLSPVVPAIQGLGYHDGFFYLAQNSGTIRRMYLDGVSEQVYATDSPGAHEGLDYSQGELRWLIDEGPGEQKIHFLVPKQR
jgi:DNA-binding beta-propeller fold protein YncE